MALDFPSSPVLNQVFTSGNRSWIWNGTEWIGNTPIINYTANSALLGNGTSLFQEVAPGTAGNLLTSNGTTWTSATAPAGGITNVVTATGNTTLTSTPTLLRITPTGYGTTVKLPDATTMTVGTGKFGVENRSSFYVRITNASDVLLGFVGPYDTVQIDLSDASTSSGGWTLSNALRLGISAESAASSATSDFVTSPAVTSAFFQSSVIQLDVNRCFLLRKSVSGNQTLGVVYDQSTNTFGAETVVRAASTQGDGAQKIDANRVLVTSISGYTLQAVVLSISGTTITVNSAASVTTPQPFGNLFGLIAMDSGQFVHAYGYTTTNHFTAFTVVGTSVTAGSTTTTSWTNNVSGAYVATAADKLVIYHPADAQCLAYSVSGTTITEGTKASISLGTTIGSKLIRLSNTAFFFDASSTGGSGYVGVAELSGTSITLRMSSVLSTDASARAQVAYAISSTKVLFNMGAASSSYTNILTYTAGSGVSLGTALSGSPLSSANTAYLIRGSSTEVALSVLNGSSSVVLDVSGSSPTVVLSFGAGSNVLPFTRTVDGTVTGLLTADLRIDTIVTSPAVQTAAGRRNVVYLNPTGNVSGTIITPVSDRTFGWINTALGSRSMYRKFELV